MTNTPIIRNHIDNAHKIKDGKQIIFVQGEKCADAVTAAGFIGTTCMGGAKAIEHSDYSSLMGQSVTLWRDNDEAGLKWQAALIAKLTSLDIEIDGVVQIPADKPPKWNAADTDPGEIRQLIAEAQEIRSDDLAFAIKDWSTAQYLAEPEEVEWHKDDAIPFGMPDMLGAKKSVQGGKANAPSKVVIITAEYSKNAIHRHLKSNLSDDSIRALNNNLFIVPTCDAGGSFLMIKRHNGEPVTTPAFEAFLQQLKEIEDLKLVIIDPLWPFIGGDITKDPELSLYMWDSFNRICKATGATVLATPRKSNGNLYSFEEARETIRGNYYLADANRLDEKLDDWDDTMANDQEKPDGA